MRSYATRILIAFGASVGVHLLVVEVWFLLVALNVITGRAVDMQKRIQVPPKREVPVLKLIEPPKPRPKPMTFVETDSRQETKEPPKDAVLYSDRSTLAANSNPDPSKAGDKPKLEGKQDKALSTANVPLPRILPESKPPVENPQPKQKAEEATKPLAEERPKVKEKSVAPEKTEIAMLTKEPEVKKDGTKTPDTKAEKNQVMVTPSKSERVLAAKESKVQGSVARKGITAFSVIGTGSGKYDKMMFVAIQSRWEALLETYTMPNEMQGHVGLSFILHEDGTISELKIEESTAREMLVAYCQMAVSQSAPFDPWPEEVKSVIKYRQKRIQILFYY